MQSYPYIHTGELQDRAHYRERDIFWGRNFTSFIVLCFLNVLTLKLPQEQTFSLRVILIILGVLHP